MQLRAFSRRFLAQRSLRNAEFSDLGFSFLSVPPRPLREINIVMPLWVRLRNTDHGLRITLPIHRYADTRHLIGSGRGDCAPRPSHTTGRAVFGIRRLNLATVSWPSRPAME